MVSYKALTILTVLFSIIIYCDGTMEECENFLVKIGFDSETGFYNLVFILQFKDYEEFTQHVKTRIDAESYNEFNSAEKYSYLAKMYTSIYSEKPDELGNDILKNPRNYCNIKIKEDIQKLEGISEATEKELFEKSIEKCTTAILKYRHEVDGKTFKYDENNHYQCLLATYDMAVLNNPKREKSKLFGKIYEKYKSEAPKGNIHNFYLYNVEVFKILFDTYGWLTPSKLCKHFLSNENTESTNIKKENTVE